MSGSGEVNREGPEVFSSHLSDLLQREHDRMATLTARGEGIARTVLSLATVLVALSALALGTDVGVRPHAATWWIVGAAGTAALAALVASSLAQAAPTKIEATDDRTMELMVGEKWDGLDDDPRRIVAKRTVEGIKSLRRGNRTRAKQAQFALWAQFAFVLLLLVAVTVEIVLT